MKPVCTYQLEISINANIVLILYVALILCSRSVSNKEKCF